MKRAYKILFWITLIILIISNIFWIYQTIDNAVGYSYYKVSCEEYHKDMLKLKQILTSKRTQNEAIEFLDNYKIDYEKFQKGDEFIISLNSFALTYNGNGVLISTDEH